MLDTSTKLSNHARNSKQKIKRTNKPKVPLEGDLGGFETGCSVRLKGQSAIGTIIEIQDKQAVVAFGQMKTTLKLSQLEAVSNNRQKRESRKYEHLGKVISDEVRERKLNFKSEIDVRGMRGDEALQAVTYFIDDALMVGVASVRILHGTGTGALRELIRQYLGTVHGVKISRRTRTVWWHRNYRGRNGINSRSLLVLFRVYLMSLLRKP